MKIITFKAAVILIWSVLLIASAGCRQHSHRKEERKIHQERAVEERATADLGDIVKATDEMAWDAAGTYTQFSDTVKARLGKNTQIIAQFKAKVSHGQRVPLRYRNRIRKLTQRNDELSQRLTDYKIRDKSSWEDFMTLYLYDLQRLELDIRKLTQH